MTGKISIALLLISIMLMCSCYCGSNEAVQLENDTFETTDPKVQEETQAETQAETQEETTGCNHEWGEWFVARFPSTKNEGIEYHYCDICGERQKRMIEKLSGYDYRKELSVENILQFPAMPNGCEIVSLAIVLNYLGFEADPQDMTDEYFAVDFSVTEADPFQVFIGDPRGYGVGCYAPCIVNAANSFLEDRGSGLRALDISGATDAELEQWIDKGVPVILWGTVYMDCEPLIYMTFETENGEVIWRDHSHCLVLIGYTADTYLFCDPQREGVSEYRKADVRDSRALVYEQACVIFDRSTE